MTKEELQKWIKKNEDSVKGNEYLIEQCKKDIEFGRKVIEEIKKIKPED